MKDYLKYCALCPHNCKINRHEKLGRCKASDKIKIALYSIHNYEEPCISGKNGSGTVFFSNCNLNCCFCQNYEISQLGKGKEISVRELADIFLELQCMNVENINLVTPTSYVIQIIEALKIAKTEGLRIPIVYNTNGYEKVETLKLLEGYIDIYLPDLKYFNNKLGKDFSNIDNYFEFVSNAIKEMFRQVGKPVLDENDIMKSGMIVRHLLLPNQIENSKNVLKWLKDTFDDNIFISIMAQYFPTYKACENSLLDRKLSSTEYEEIENYIFDLDIQKGFMQDLGDHEEEFVPKWNLD